MPITLRIVGLFYIQDNIPDVQPDGSPQTVESVLNYAVTNPVAPATDFGYITGQSNVVKSGAVTPGVDSITAFYANYGGATGPTSITAGITYPPGEYFLSESLVDSPQYTVWQYYVFNAALSSGTAVYQPRSPRIQSYTTATVPENGQVTWRLVEILSGPKPVPGVYRNSLGLSKVISLTS
ncbi:MAG: hypothetical protein AAF829_05050 [Pseudomonadota bacterium]